MKQKKKNSAELAYWSWSIKWSWFGYNYNELPNSFLWSLCRYVSAISARSQSYCSSFLDHETLKWLKINKYDKYNSVVLSLRFDSLQTNSNPSNVVISDTEREKKRKGRDKTSHKLNTQQLTWSENCGNLRKQRLLSSEGRERAAAAAGLQMSGYLLDLSCNGNIDSPMAFVNSLETVLLVLPHSQYTHSRFTCITNRAIRLEDIQQI